MTTRVHIDYERAELLAGQGLSRKQLAYCLGIGESTVYKKLNTDIEFREAIKRGRAKGLETISNALFEAGKNGNVTSMIFYLKNRDPERWQDRRNTELTGKDGGPIGILPFEFVDAEDTAASEKD